MLLESIKEYIRDQGRELEIKLGNIEINGKKYFQICDKVVFPIKAISNYYSREDFIDIKNESQDEIGTIYFTKGKNINDELSDEEFIAYLNYFHTDLINEHTFENDTLILKSDYLEEYISYYYDTSMLWGEFSHIEKEIVPFTITVNEILARKDLNFPTDYHRQNILRSLNIHHSFERFLKYYHHFELLFDFDLIERIKTITDYKESAKLLSEYKKDEIERLKFILKTRLKNKMDILKLIKLIENITNNNTTCIDLLFNYGKESNPFKGNQQVYENIVNGNGFSETEVKKHYKKIKNTLDYENLLKDFIAYILYRTRCSIAHNKIGEYMFDNSKEQFISEAIIPLIKEVILELD